MSGDNGASFVAVLIVLGILTAVLGAGIRGERIRWEHMLVDQPGTVAAIKSRVLAERAEAESK